MRDMPLTSGVRDSSCCLTLHRSLADPQISDDRCRPPTAQGPGERHYSIERNHQNLKSRRSEELESPAQTRVLDPVNVLHTIIMVRSLRFCEILLWAHN